jgi:hypothetical protein
MRTKGLQLSLLTIVISLAAMTQILLRTPSLRLPTLLRPLLLQAIFDLTH